MMKIRQHPLYGRMKNSILKIKISRRDEAIFYNNIGHQQYMKVNFDEAVKNYSKAIQLDNSLGVAYYNRGTVLYRLGIYKDACNDFQNAVEYDPMNKEFNLALRHCKQQVHHRIPPDNMDK